MPDLHIFFSMHAQMIFGTNRHLNCARLPLSPRLAPPRRAGSQTTTVVRLLPISSTLEKPRQPQTVRRSATTLKDAPSSPSSATVDPPSAASYLLVPGTTNMSFGSSALLPRQGATVPCR